MKQQPANRLVLLLFGALLCTAARTQLKIPALLEQRLQGKSRFDDVQSEVESFYRQQLQLAGNDSLKTRLINRQRKFWNRWLWWAESHLDENGEVVKNNTERLYRAAKSKAANATTDNARSAFGDWSFRGPSSAPDGVGRVNRVAFHPTNANLVYAGTSAGGLWRLTWSGSSYTWACLTNSIPELSISGIVVSHANANTLYVLTGDGDATSGFVNTWGYRGSSIGVLKSTDGGQTWASTAAFPSTSGTVLGFQLVQDPNDAYVLLAATNQGLFRSANGGASWTAASFANTANVDLANNNVAFDVEFKPGSSATVYAAYQRSAGSNSASIFKSTDGGLTFKEKLSFSGVNRMGIAVTPANSSFVYLVCGPGNIQDGNAGNNTFKGLFFSSNSGDSFSPQTTAPDILGNITPTLVLGHQSSYDLAIAAAPNNASIVMVGGLVVWKSENKGVDFDEMTDYFPSDPDDDDCIHPDVHDLAYNPLDGRLYAATDGGVSVSSDHGDHFTTLFTGLAIGQFYHFEPSNEDGNVWGGTQDCGVLEQSSGTVFSLWKGGDGYDVLTDKTGNNDDSYVVVNQGIYDDSPAGFDNITPSSETEFFPLLAMHPSDEDILYAGYTNALYRSLERGDNWQQVSGTTARWALTACPSNSSRVYCAGNQSTSLRGLRRVDGITNTTPTVTSLNSGLLAAGYPSGFPKITGICVNPSNSAQVWISVGGFNEGAKVFFSSDAGSNWENRSGSLPNVPATSILTDASGNTYVGTDIGVFYRNSGMTDWTPFYNDLPRVAVTDLAFLDVFNPIDPANPVKYIYASTFGRGIWRSEIYATCTSSLSVTQGLQGQQSFQAGTSLTSTSVISAGLGTEVYFQSGNNVTLTPGFEVRGGSVFKSIIRPCNSGPLYPARVAVLNEGSHKMINSEAETYGRILGVETTGAAAVVDLRINTEGRYTLQLHPESGEAIIYVFTDRQLGKGDHRFTVPVQTVKAGFYHVQLLFSNEVVHFQEFEKK